MKKFWCRLCSVRIDCRGATRYPSRHPVIAYAFENPPRTKASGENSSALRSSPS